MIPRLSTVRGILCLICVLGSIDSAWGFGSHGDGKIDSGPDPIGLPGGLPLLQNMKIQNFEVPVSYPSLSRKDIAPETRVIDVQGESSMRAIVIPLGIVPGFNLLSGLNVDVGNRGVEEAIADAKARYGVQEMYDVRIDRRRFSVACLVVVCLYSKITTIVHGKGVVDESAPAPSP